LLQTWRGLHKRRRCGLFGPTTHAEVFILVADDDENARATEDPAVAAYRIGVIAPLGKREVLARFEGFLRTPFAFEDAIWECIDGSEIRFRPSGSLDEFHVDFRVRFHAHPDRSVSFGLLPDVLRLATHHCSDVKVRGRDVLPANGGGVMSDVYWSEAFRLAQHKALNPHDAHTHQGPRQDGFAPPGDPTPAMP
jgi:hypothetical protein